MKKTLLFITTIFLTACSQKAVYDNIQLNNRIQCDKVPLSEYDACMERASKSYEDYERQRREVDES